MLLAGYFQALDSIGERKSRFASPLPPQRNQQARLCASSTTKIG
jgi:hypothetical protein